MRFFQFIYFFFTLITSLLLALPFMLNTRGRKRLLERYGFWKLHSDQELVWLHAASLGEVNALLPVIKQLKSVCTQPILLTATSVEGLAKAQSLVEHVRLLPFDNWIWHKLALRKLRIKLFIFSETEIWPALLQVLNGKAVQICMINATISDYSWPWFKSAAFFFRKILPQFKLILAASQVSAERFQRLGARAESLSVCGNSKFDLQPSVPSEEAALTLYRKLFSNPLPILVLGSLRPAEETVWFEAVAQAYTDGLRFNLLVAPRHPQKFDYFAQKLDSYQIRFSRRSQIDASKINRTDNAPEVVLLDSLGELEASYSFADLVFIGGTLQNWGGHNPLEAAAYGCFILMGPHRSKVSALFDEIMAKGAAAEVRNSSDIRKILEDFTKNVQKYRERGDRSREVYLAQNGAAHRISQRLIEFLQENA